MKQTAIILMWVLLFAVPSFGQVEEEIVKDKPVIEMGINTTFLLFRLLNFNGSAQAPTTETYFLTFKRINGKNAVRSAMGFDLVSAPFFTFGSQDRETLFFKYRLGYERQIPLLKHFQINTGIDAVTQINTRSVTTFDFNGFSESFKENKLALGFSTFLAFEYRLTDRLSFFTETEFAYFHHRTTSRNQNSCIGCLERKTINEGDRFNFSMPISLFFSVKF